MKQRRTVAPRAVLAVASLGAFMAFVDSTIVNVAIPDIQESFEDVSISSLSWVLNAYNVVFAAFLVPAGRFADLLGRKRFFEWGIVLFVVTSVLCAVAPSQGFLVAARSVQALGAAIVVPASLALVLHAFGPGQRAHAVALFGAAAAIAAGLGPTLGGVLVALADWRLVFLVNVPVGIAAIAASKRTLVESRAPGRRTTPDLLGALILAAAIALLTFGIVQGGEWGWTSGSVLASWAAAALLGGWFLRRCTWHGSPVVQLQLLRGRSFGMANALTLVASTGFFAYLLANVLFLTSVWGYSVLEAGLALTPGPLVAAIVAAPLGRVLERHDYRLAVIPGALIWAGGVVMLTQLGSTPDFVGGWLPAIVVLGIGAGATLPTLGAAAVAAAPGGNFATATALNSVGRQLGAVLGVALLVAIVGTPAPEDVASAFDDGWAFAAACFAVVSVLAVGLGRIATMNEVADDERARARRVVVAPLGPVRQLEQSVAAAPLHLAPTPADVLATVSIFSELAPELRAETAERARVVRLAGGDWLFRVGDAGDALFVVLSGRCEVVDADGRVILVLGRGAVLGELALLTGGTRSASVRAARDTELLELSRGEFERLLREEPAFAVSLTAELGRQLAASRPREAPSRNQGATMAIVAVTPDAPLGTVVDGLVEELSRWETVARVDRLPPEGIEGAPAILDGLEHHHDRVVMTGSVDADDTWVDLALRQADRVVALVGRGDIESARRLTPALRGCDLVFLDGAVVEGRTGSWLDVLAPRATHRVAADDLDEHVRRLARRLAGRAPGLVLSGGGARALAHVGVIEELLGAGVVVDRVAGVSMGSFVAALLARGLDPQEIDAYVYEEWVRRSPLSDYRWPRTSLLRGARVRDMFARLLPEQIETLPRDFFCVSCDLVSGEPVIHRRGLLAFAVSASGSLPGMCPPVAGLDDRLLVDGGVISNLPVDVMADAGEGPVIAVDVSKRFEPPENVARRRHRRLLAPRDLEEWPWDEERTLPTITESLTRLVMIGSQDTDEAARRHADLVISPVNDGVGLLEFHQLDQMIDAGRRATAEALEQAPADVLSRLVG